MQNYLLLLEGHLWRPESARAHGRDGDTGSSSPGRSQDPVLCARATGVNEIRPLS